MRNTNLRRFGGRGRPFGAWSLAALAVFSSVSAGTPSGIAVYLSVASAGGGRSSGGRIVMNGTVGQPGAAPMISSVKYSVASGFWNLPAVFKVAGVSRPDTTRVTKVLLATLRANHTDLAGGPLSITAVGDALPAGATVAISGAFVVYVASSSVAGHGSFTYTVTDGNSSVTRTVTVTETAASGADASPNSASLTTVGGDFALKFLGVPGRNYGVRYTTDTAPPYIWRAFTPPVSLLAPDSGVLSYTDVGPSDPLRLYNVVLLP